MTEKKRHTQADHDAYLAEARAKAAAKQAKEQARKPRAKRKPEVPGLGPKAKIPNPGAAGPRGRSAKVLASIPDEYAEHGITQMDAREIIQKTLENAKTGDKDALKQLAVWEEAAQRSGADQSVTPAAVQAAERALVALGRKFDEMKRGGRAE